MNKDILKKLENASWKDKLECGVIPAKIVFFDDAKYLIVKALSSQRKEILKEMIKLSDKIESELGTPEQEEWRAFKYFRNTLNDELDNKSGTINGDSLYFPK